MNKLFLRVTFIVLLAVPALYGGTLSAKDQSGSGLETLPTFEELFPLTFEELFPLLAKAQLGSGLEIDNPEKIGVLIEGLDDDAKEAGLSKSLIMAKVNLRLRQNKLVPINLNPGNANNIQRSKKLWDGFLYVNVSVINNAYGISVSFIRVVSYYSKGQLFTMSGARTWNRRSTGTFEGDANFILNSLENHIDVFIDAYQSANSL